MHSNQYTQMIPGFIFCHHFFVTLYSMKVVIRTGRIANQPFIFSIIKNNNDKVFRESESIRQTLFLKLPKADFL